MSERTVDSHETATDTVEIVHQPDEHRFIGRGAGGPAVLNYRLRDGSMVFTHTEVPEALEGQGLGGALVRAGLEHARAHDLKVVPRCPFVRAWIRRHPEFEELVGPDERGGRPG